jgi:hypothetical protein
MFFIYNNKKLIFHIHKTLQGDIMKYRFVLMEVLEKFNNYLLFINLDKSFTKKGQEISDLSDLLSSLAGLELTLNEEEFQTEIIKFFGFNLGEAFNLSSYLSKEFLNRPSQLKTLINNTLQKINGLQENKITLDLEL